MDREALVRLAGEQALLSKERADLAATHQRDLHAISGLSNTARDAANAQWLDAGKALLERIHATKVQLDSLDARINDLRQLTGL